MILIAGATGFVGSSLSSFLASKTKILKLGKSSIDAEDYVQCDLRNPLMVKKILRQYSPSTIIHLVANKEKFPNKENFSSYFDTNVGSTRNILKYSPKNCRIIFFSSAAVYGDTKIPQNEWVRPTPQNVYGLTKAYSEKLLLCGNIDSLIFRPFNIYSTEQGFMRDLIYSNKTHTITGLNYMRDYVSLDAVCEIVWQAITEEKEHDIYNIGSGKGVSMREILNLINNHRPIDYRVHEKHINFDSVADATRLKQDFKVKVPSILNTIKDEFTK